MKMPPFPALPQGRKNLRKRHWRGDDAKGFVGCDMHRVFHRPHLQALQVFRTFDVALAVAHVAEGVFSPSQRLEAFGIESFSKAWPMGPPGTARACAPSQNRKATSRIFVSGTKLSTGPVDDRVSAWVSSWTALMDSRSPPREPLQ